VASSGERSHDVHPSTARSDKFSRVAIISCATYAALCVCRVWLRMCWYMCATPPPLPPSPPLLPPLPPSQSSSSLFLSFSLPPVPLGYRSLRNSRQRVQLTARLWNVYARRSKNACPTARTISALVLSRVRSLALARARSVVSARQQRWFHPCRPLIRARIAAARSLTPSCA